MANEAQLFRITENASNQAVATRAVQEGDAVAAKNGILGFAFKDASGNAIAAPVKQSGAAPADAVPVLAFLNSGGNLAYPQLNASGQLPVSLDTGSALDAYGTNAGSLSQVTLATITLTNSKLISEIEFMGSSFRDAEFEIEWNDNGSPSTVAQFLVGSGQPSFGMMMKNLTFTTGATGTQELHIKALNVDKASTLHGTIACRQAA